MTNHKIINYSQRYLYEIIQCWNDSMLYDPINMDKFKDKILLDENFDSQFALVCLEDERVIGFCLGLKRKYPYLTRGLEENRGWISIMFIHPSHQRKGMGQLLYNELEKRFFEKGINEITLCAYSPNYFTPGIDIKYKSAEKFFMKNGYIQGHDAVSMHRNLWGHYLSKEMNEKIDVLRKEKIEFKHFEFSYMEKLLNFANNEFGGGWARNVLEAIKKNEANKNILICVDESETIIGFCMRKIDGNDSRFGPIGVKEEYRSKGLGGILLELMMNDMKKNEIFYLYFLWTHGDAMRFYEKHGFEVSRQYYLYRKVI